MKNQYLVLDKALKEHEEYGYALHSLSWIADRIVWAYKWRHISQKEMNELADRTAKLFEREKDER